MTHTSTTRSLGGKAIRDRQRLAHLVLGMAVIAYVYAPGHAGSILDAAVRWVIVPLAAASGALLWQWPKIRRWIRRRSRTS